MGISIKMVYATCVKQRSAPLDPMNDVTFAKQQFGQVGTILAGNSGYESSSRQGYTF